MYFVGVWVTAKRFAAESDEEAIFDADNEPRVASNNLQYTLFCGNRKVQEYPAPTNPHVQINK